MQKSRQLLAIIALAIGFTTAVQTQAPTNAQNNRAATEKITLTGCVERADQMNATGTAATTTVDSMSFVLIHATKGTAAEAPRGTTGTTPAAEQGRMYRLDAATSKLNSHVGHKVEVTGTLDPTTPDDPATANPGSLSSAPRLTVDTVKMLAETCAR